MALPEDTTSWTTGVKPTISEPRHAENYLQNDEERFHALFENSIDAVLLISTDGRIEAANPEARQLLDRTEEEICQLNWAELLDPTDSRLQLLLRDREQTGRFRGELNCRRKDGSVFHGEVSSTSYRDKSGAFKASVIIRDITERKRVAETLRDIVEGTAGSTGDDFFCSLVKHLSHALQVRYSFVAECTDETKKRVRMLAFWAGEALGEKIEFPLAGTPCESVIQGNVCSYPDQLQALFPKDEGLVRLGAQSYAGVPVRNPSGNVLGHLVVMDDNPRIFGEQAFSMLQIFATRAAVELERVRAHKELQSLNAELGVLLDINRAVGRYLDRDKLFGALASCLKKLVPTDRFGLEFPIEGGKLQGHILSGMPTNGVLTQPAVLPAAGTACDWVMQNRAWFVAASGEELRDRFPVTFNVMSMAGMESLCALPLISGDRIQGALYFMAAAKGAYGKLRREFLEQLASQIGIAVENMTSYEQIATLNNTIAASAHRRRTLLDINNAIVSKLTRDELFTAIAEVLGRVISFDRLSLSLYDSEAHVLRLVTYTGPYRRDDYTPIGRILEVHDSPVGQAFVTQKPVLRGDLEAERKTSSEERAFSHGFRSLCSLPLIVRGKSIGGITVGSLTSNQYTEADAEFLLEVANQIAIAVDNMRSHEETEALKARFQSEAVYLQEEIKTEHNFEEIIGQSEPVQQLLRKLAQVAPTDSAVLIQGETGTGKELLARAVHDRSRRKDRPLVKVNCGSIPSGLVESELFGHEKGAFTGATQRRIGRFELSHGGTIFLDEVTELPTDTQVKLLRVLQEGEFERVGSSQTIKIDVRVIAATNRDVSEAVKGGVFRADLFYRLNVFPLEVPPLRDRKGDIPLLVNFFLSKFAKKLGKELRGVSRAGMEKLLGYQWPGNIRELQNIVERAVIIASGPVTQIDDSSLARSGVAEQPAPVDTLESVERNHIMRALNDTHWVIHGKKGAAEILGINPSTLRSRMAKLGIVRPL